MRKLIRRWLMSDSYKGEATNRVTLATEGRVPTTAVQRIGNGFLVIHDNSVMYCKALEELPGLVAAAFALDMVAPKQLDMFDKLREADNSLFNRPLNQPHV